MNREIYKGKWVFGAALCLLAIAVMILIIPMDLGIAVLQRPTKEDIILLDPGHGGIDSGASGSGGVCEKNINLSIALTIKRLAEADGWAVVMTREDDSSLSPRQDRQSIRSMKTEDLLARKKVIEETEPTVAVSIHLNSFKQDQRVRGAQTFYPGSGDQIIRDESKLLAEIIQENLVKGISDGTDRVALAKSDVLMLKNPIAPIVIVECGFLSNPEEERLLNTEDYQRKLAECIYKGIMEYTGKSGRPPLQIIDNRV